MNNLLTIDQGDDEAIDLTITKPDTTAADLSGCKLWFYVKAARSDPDAAALIAKDSDDPLEIEITAPPTAGKAVVYIPKEDTAALDSQYLGRSLHWQLQILDGADKVITLARGPFQIKRDLINTVV